MLESKRPGLTITEEPGGMLRKQLLDYDGTILLDETMLPHDDLICFMHRPLKEYSLQLTELEKHPLFRESLDVSILDLRIWFHDASLQQIICGRISLKRTSSCESRWRISSQ